MDKTLRTIGTIFCLPGEMDHFEIITNGNVNTTYKVSYKTDAGRTDYIFQKINTVAFHHPEEIMENIDRVTRHINEYFPDDNTLLFYRDSNGRNYCYDENGNFWRVMNYVDSITFNSCDNLDVVESVGQAFGHFAMQLSDFDGDLLYETIPDFHNTEKRLSTLFEDTENENYKGERLDEIAEDLAYISKVRKLASDLSIKYNARQLPVRVTHNDTKCNNVLFDKETLQPLVVIDYDTIMPGMAIYDFGDAVRSIANNSSEGETDLSKVYLDKEKFTAFSKGYFSQVKDSLTKEEIENMALGAFSITIELASRFLDDYIKGDVYFNVAYPKHNLDRGRCQLALAKDMYDNLDVMKAIIEEMCK
ncbi:MAG: aminoglycoside phosphotransferase family protein [Lachnospiraceae bacterium]|nr:aminoglycoside phosphotransferase family protein [Lachnospiraceae bacterium]